jgi:hypothetical protein
MLSIRSKFGAKLAIIEYAGGVVLEAVSPTLQQLGLRFSEHLTRGIREFTIKQLFKKMIDIDAAGEPRMIGYLEGVFRVLEERLEPRIGPVLIGQGSVIWAKEQIKGLRLTIEMPPQSTTMTMSRF